MTRFRMPRRHEPARGPEDRAPGMPQPGAAAPRRRYRRPRLECHGRLAEVTRFGGSQIIDSGGGLGQQP
jgi:hypothetical protein